MRYWLSFIFSMWIWKSHFPPYACQDHLLKMLPFPMALNFYFCGKSVNLIYVVFFFFFNVLWSRHNELLILRCSKFFLIFGLLNMLISMPYLFLAFHFSWLTSGYPSSLIADNYFFSVNFPWLTCRMETSSMFFYGKVFLILLVMTIIMRFISWSNIYYCQTLFWMLKIWQWVK